MRYYNSGELINSEIKKATIILNNKKSNFYYIKKKSKPKNNPTTLPPLFGPYPVAGTPAGHQRERCVLV